MRRIACQLGVSLFLWTVQAAGMAYAQPRKQTPAAPATQPYTVERGDTLIGISKRLLVPRADWRVLQRLNRVADPLRLPPGRTLLLPVALLREQPATAEALHVFGTVTASRGGGAHEPLLPASLLADGDVVRTGPGASATLRFADGSRVLIRPDSELRVERLAQSGDRRATRTELRLERGAADSTVTPAKAPGTRRYEIRTPVANLGVRGTRFRSEASDGQAKVEVLEGRVGAAQGRRETPIAEGFGAVAGSTPIRVRQLLAPPALGDVPEHVDRLPLVLRWPQAPGAAAYRAQVLRDGLDDALVADARSTAPTISYGEDLADGQYVLRVRAIDADGIEGRDASTAFVLKARPEPPFLQRPAAEATVYEGTVAFAWSRQQAAARYRLQVSDTPDFATTRVDRSDLTSNEVTLALPLGTHHWRVATIAADGDQGPFSDTQSLARRDPPPAPPPAESKSTDKGVSLRWRASEEPGARYPWQLAGKEGGFEPPLREGVSAEPALLLENLLAGRYRLRVRTVNADGVAGPWGAPQEIEVPYSKWWWLLASPLLLLL